MNEILCGPQFGMNITTEAGVGVDWKIIMVSRRAAEFMFKASELNQWKRPCILFKSTHIMYTDYLILGLNIHTGGIICCRRRNL